MTRGFRVLEEVASRRHETPSSVLRDRTLPGPYGQHQCARVSLPKESGQVVLKFLHERTPEVVPVRSTL